MNTTTISMSAKDAAIAAIAAFETYQQVKRNASVAESTLDALPKTPTGKDTKAVKEGKQALVAKLNEAYAKYSSKSDDFGNIFRKSVAATNASHACPFVVDRVMESFGYKYCPETTGKVIETAVSIKQYNKAQKDKDLPQFAGSSKDHGHIMYSHESDRVYSNGDTYFVLGFYDRCYYTYNIRYVGGEPVLTPFGLAFYRNYACYGMSTFEDNLLSELRVNFSSIGREFGPNAVKRLKTICEIVEIADALMTRAPFVECRNIHAEYDHDLMEACANGEAIAIVRHTSSCDGEQYVPFRVNRVATQKAVKDLGGDIIHVAAVSITDKHDLPGDEEDSN